MKKPLLDVDPKGFARVQGDKPKGRMLAELYQNAKDEDGVTKIKIDLVPVGGKQACHFYVEDNSKEGFADLSHAYTLFAPSYKLDNPEKSGWMNLGEKMVIVGCKWCRISTTKGEVYFDMEDQTREEFPRRKREVGTVVEGELKMTRDELEDALRFLEMLVPPKSINVYLNDRPFRYRKLHGEFRCKLPTRILGKDGMPAPSIRETAVKVWEVLEGEEPHIYELGIPVVPFAPQDGMKWHVDCFQKVPLNKDRDNVTPKFKSLLLVEVLNHLYEEVKKEDVTANWVVEAASQPEAIKEATEHVLDEAYGKKRVAFSITDPEANHKAVANGYTVIPSRGMTPGMRDNAKSFGLLPVSHDLFRTPKPFSDDPDAPMVEIVPMSEWSEGMKNIVRYAKFLGNELLDRHIDVLIVKELGGNSAAAFGPAGTLYFSLRKLGWRWFDEPDVLAVDELVIHEFGHNTEDGSNHLSEGYYKALCKLAAKLKQVALAKPAALKEFFR